MERGAGGPERPERGTDARDRYKGTTIDYEKRCEDSTSASVCSVEWSPYETRSVPCPMHPIMHVEAPLSAPAWRRPSEPSRAAAATLVRTLNGQQHPLPAGYPCVRAHCFRAISPRNVPMCEPESVSAPRRTQTLLPCAMRWTMRDGADGTRHRHTAHASRVRPCVPVCRYRLGRRGRGLGEADADKPHRSSIHHSLAAERARTSELHCRNGPPADITCTCKQEPLDEPSGA